ncbi:MAG: HAD family phosphatase [Treponema sp.]|jgi:HAD superfamily hydrolase (TIGR01509 family)|nr:HAD family phosphatase [Treponema sp.]
MKSFLEYPGAIFDLDGTLTRSMHVWDHVCRDWLRARGKIPRAELEADIAAMTVTQSAAYVKERYGIGSPGEEITAQWQDMILDSYRTSIELKEEVAALVPKFLERGARLAVATSCFPAACEAVLERHGLRDAFTAILYTDQSPGGKGDPHIWRMAASRLSLAPQECAAFEDDPRALAGAKSAGMAAAAVYDESCREWELMKTLADWVIGPV